MILFECFAFGAENYRYRQREYFYSDLRMKS